MCITWSTDKVILCFVVDKSRSISVKRDGNFISFVYSVQSLSVSLQMDMVCVDDGVSLINTMVKMEI